MVKKSSKENPNPLREPDKEMARKRMHMMIDRYLDAGLHVVVGGKLRRGHVFLYYGHGLVIQSLCRVIWKEIHEQNEKSKH